MTINTAAETQIGGRKEIRVTIIMWNNKNTFAPKINDSPVVSESDDVDRVTNSEKASVDSTTPIIGWGRSMTLQSGFDVVDVGYCFHTAIAYVTYVIF